MVIPAIVYLILIVFGILNLILFFKLWGMCNDMRKLKYFLTSRFSLEAENARKERQVSATGAIVKDGRFVYGVHTFCYKLYDDDRVEMCTTDNRFDFKGNLKTYSGHTMCGVYLGRTLCMYKDMENALSALVTYNLEDGRIDKDGLIEKR